MRKRHPRTMQLLVSALLLFLGSGAMSVAKPVDAIVINRGIVCDTLLDMKMAISYMETGLTDVGGISRLKECHLVAPGSIVQVTKIETYLSDTTQYTMAQIRFFNGSCRIMYSYISFRVIQRA